MKPEYFHDEDISDLSRDTRLLYIGLWGLADEHARLRGDPRWVKGQIFAYDDDLDPSDIAVMLDALHKAGKAVKYTVGGRAFLYLPTLARHQRLDAEKVPSRLPPPEAGDLGPEPPPPSPGPDPNTSGPGPNSRVPDPTSSEPRADTSEPHTDTFVPEANSSGSGANVSGNFPDSSGNDANSSAPMQVAGSRVQGAGGRESAPARAPDAAVSDIDLICERLADRMVDNRCPRPQITKAWRAAARQILTVNQRDPAEVVAVIDWCQNDSFWRSNVLSLPKVLEKYDQLRLALEHERTRSTVGSYTPFVNPPVTAYEGDL